MRYYSKTDKRRIKNKNTSGLLPGRGMEGLLGMQGMSVSDMRAEIEARMQNQQDDVIKPTVEEGEAA